MHSDQTRKYGISEFKIQALIMTLCDFVGNKVIIRACILNSEMPYFLVFSFGPYASLILVEVKLNGI